MNNDNLHELISRYKNNYEMLNKPPHEEIFKWKAVKHFQNVWFAENAEARPFPELFKDAIKECDVLIDGSSMVPANGIVKIAEQKPDEVEHLFRGILFADDGGDIAKRQNNLHRFLGEIEEIRQITHPRNWKYKQDNHSATCYLALYAPEENFIYRYSNVSKFARYVEFGLEIGSGSGFNLENYYILCEHIVEALREHKDLLDMHFAKITDAHYRDDSLHIMAFDLLYCAWVYDYFEGLVYTGKAKIKAAKMIPPEIEIKLLKQEIAEKEEILLDRYGDLSLINIEVSSRDYGKGIITQHEGVHITVQYETIDVPKKYEINRRFTSRPTFENDEEIAGRMFDYADALRELHNLRAQLSRLEKCQ